MLWASTGRSRLNIVALRLGPAIEIDQLEQAALERSVKALDYQFSFAGWQPDEALQDLLPLTYPFVPGLET